MGWSFGWSSPSSLRAELNSQRGSLKIVKQSATCYGRHLWTLYEQPDGGRFISLDLIERSGADWGYKSIDESMGPVEVDCPLAIIDAAGEPSGEYAPAWRERVRAFHAKNARKYAPNDVVLVYGKRYRVISSEKRSYRVINIETGRIYKCSPKKMFPAPADEN